MDDSDNPFADLIPNEESEDLAAAPLSAYTPGQGDPKMEGGFETFSGAPMYTLEAYHRGEAPYVTGATNNPADIGKKIWRDIGNSRALVGITDHGPGVKGIDIATENKAWATNFPFQGQTDANNPFFDLIPRDKKAKLGTVTTDKGDVVPLPAKKVEGGVQMGLVEGKSRNPFADLIPGKPQSQTPEQEYAGKIKEFEKQPPKELSPEEMARTGTIRAEPSEITGGTEPDPTPLISPETIKTGYKSSPLYWIGKAVAPEKTEEIATGLSRAASGFTTNQNAEFIAASPLFPEGTAGKLFGTGLAAYFEAQAIQQFPDKWKEFSQTTDRARKWELASEMAGSLGMPVLMVMSSLGLRSKGGETDAKQPSNEKVEGGETAQREQTRPEGEEQEAGGSGDVEREAEGGQAGGLPQEAQEVRGEQAGLAPAVPLDFYEPDQIAAIHRGVEYYKQAGLSDEEAFHNAFRDMQDIPKPDPKTLPQNGEPQKVEQIAPSIGIAERYREEQQPGSVEPGKIRDAKYWREHGRTFINKGGDPRTAVRAAIRGETSPANVGKVGAEYERLAAKTESIAASLDDDPNNPVLKSALKDAMKEQADWSVEMQPVLTRAGESLASIKEAFPVDESTFSGLYTKAMEFSGGIDINEAQKVDLVRRAAKVRSAKRAETDAINRLQKEIDRTSPKRAAPPTDLEMKAEVEKLVEELTPCQ